MKIAVIEDDAADRALLKRAFRHNGTVDIREYAAGREAVASICGDPDGPDIVITDYGLGEESGVEVFDQLRKGAYAGPVVLMTGVGNESVAVTALKRGFADYITKSPETFSQLEQLVTHIVARARAEQDRHVAQQTNEETTRRLTEISESASVWFWEMDAEFRFSYLGGTAFEGHGLAPHDCLGKTPWEIQGLTAPEGWAGFRRILRQRGPVQNFMCVYRAGNGAPDWIVALSGRPFSGRNGFAGHRGIARDVTELHAAESRFRMAEDRLRTAVESLNDAFILYDSDGRVVLHNRRMLDVFDFLAGRDDVLGLSVEALLKDGLEAKFFGSEEVNGDPETWLSEQLARYRTPSEVPIERRVASGNWLRSSMHPTPEGGVVEVIADVTAERGAREQLRQAQKMEAIGQLTGGVAHDFNNLLTVIMGNINLLRDGLKTRPDLDRFAAVAVRAAERGAGLTHHLLAFARKQPLNATVVDLGAMARDVHQMIDRTIGETYSVGVSVPGAPLLLRLDAAQFQNAALNLALNARDAMPEGGSMVLEVERETVPKRLRAVPDDVPAGDYAVFRVVDSGTGMSSETLRQCCEPFYTTKGTGKGSGLGLSMVYGFVQQSGGAVVIDSHEGRGTTISLYFPSCGVQDESSDEAVGAAARVSDKLAGTHVLLVEDDPDVRTVVRTMLLDLGCTVLDVAGGSAALDALDGGYRPDLLFTDFVLYGGMDGRELAARAAERVPDLKILFTSGYFGGGVMDGAAGERKDGFLGKPFTPDDLAAKLRDVIK
jgi:PAS domain S-box-containing protein